MRWSEPTIAICVVRLDERMQRIEQGIEGHRIEIVEVAPKHQRIAVLRREFPGNRSVHHADRPIDQHVLADHDAALPDERILDAFFQHEVHLHEPLHTVIDAAAGDAHAASVGQHFVLELAPRRTGSIVNGNSLRPYDAPGLVKRGRHGEAVLQHRAVAVVPQVCIVDGVHQAGSARGRHRVSIDGLRIDRAIRCQPCASPETISEATFQVPGLDHEARRLPPEPPCRDPQPAFGRAQTARDAHRGFCASNIALGHNRHHGRKRCHKGHEDHGQHRGHPTSLCCMPPHCTCTHVTVVTSSPGSLA